MAIIFPANTKGMTAGAMRQIKQQGYTTASGGWHDFNHLTSMAADGGIYLNEREPLGRFMSALEKTKARLGSKAQKVNWVVKDITEFKPLVKFDFWYDRAVFHFLIDTNLILNMI